MVAKKAAWGYICRAVALFLGVFFLSKTLPIQVLAVEAFHSAKTQSKKIALTFDDGPHPSQTKRILDVLDRYHVHATFFMVGVNIENYPDAAKEVIARGHEVGNHTYSHAKIGNMSESDVDRELERCEEILDELCDYEPHLFRPPQGALSDAVEGCSFEHDYRLVLWSLDTRDWEVKNTDQIVKKVLSSIQGGDIVLMHDYIGTHSRTAEALEILLPELIARGYEPVTVSELLEE
ncbi:MAG: polysaccharide deacetylase family protein [Clostridia bacterium]|nr:polysaccharide deacetylase family protein [Clostridia bacterium]